MALIIGLLKSSGLIFVAFQEKFKSSSSMTSLPSTIQNIVFSIMGEFDAMYKASHLAMLHA